MSETTDDPQELLLQVVAALRFARWSGAESVDRAWATPLPQIETPALRPTVAPLPPPMRQPLPGPSKQPLPPPQARTLPPMPRVEDEPRTLPRPLPRPELLRPELPRVRPGLAEATRLLQELRETIGDCQLCNHAAGRQHIVHGVGNPAARLMIVGSAPGLGEDVAGQPWQGQAGELLDKMLGAMGLARGELWLTSLVLCRVPEGGAPQRPAIVACSPFLRKQWDIVQPEVVLAFGEPAGRFLTRNQQPMAQLRGKWTTLHGSQVLATWAPEDVLQTPALKREVWADLQLVMGKLGLQRRQ